MHVVDHEPGHWFLLGAGDRLYLDVNCTQGAFGGSLLIMLDDAETRALRERGRDALNRLADAVQDSAPLARGSRSPYRGRDLSRTHDHLVTEAVVAWRGER